LRSNKENDKEKVMRVKQIIIKFYEEEEEHPLLIHKEAKKEYFITKNTISSVHVLNILKKEDKWLEKVNPIKLVELYNSEEKYLFMFNI
jgi:hypothetical protein